jgi:hypothetical protein
LKEAAKLDAVMLLARPLKAASPDAKHPGKAWEQSPGESSLSPWDFPGFLGPEAFYLAFFPAQQAKVVFSPK